MTTFLKVMIALVIVSLLMSGGGHANVATGQGAYCATQTETDMLRRINAFRQQNGLAPLTLSQPLGAAATAKSRDMATRDYLAHVSPGGLGPRDLLDTIGYPGNTTYGEILAAGNSDAGATFNQWQNSQSHRDIMLGGEFDAVGIARAQDPNSRYGWYWTAMFGGDVVTPAGACGATAPPAASPANALVARLVAILARILN